MLNKFLHNKDGVALVTALMMTLLSLGIIMSLLYIITQSIKISSASKRFISVKEASYGGAEIMAQDVLSIAWKNYSSGSGMSTSLTSTFNNINLSVSASEACLKQKLTMPPSAWTSCTTGQKSEELANIKSAPDMSFLLKSASAGQHYKIYSKIVDTSTGNTDTWAGGGLDPADEGGLMSGGGSSYSKSGGNVKVPHIPYSYRIEVQGEKDNNPIEKLNVTVLYAY